MVETIFMGFVAYTVRFNKIDRGENRGFVILLDEWHYDCFLLIFLRNQCNLFYLNCIF